MAIFRGVGGSGDSSDNSFLQEVTAQAQAAEASATSAQASANSILNLTAATGAAGSNASYDASTGVLTVPRGADGSDANVTAANVTSVLTGGTGISIASNGTITNDSPDQTVALTGTGATTVTGTYPNFTINSTNTTYTVGDGGLTTNDFTDADHTKLDGIEASADVTDTANVTSAGAAMLASSPTFTGTITAPNVDISTTGSVTTNIATGGAGSSGSTKTVNIGTGFSGFFGGLTTVNIGTQNATNINEVNIGSGAQSGYEDTINLKGDVNIDGTLAVGGNSYERTARLRFQKRGYSNTSSFLTLNTGYQQIGQSLRLNDASGVACEHELELNMILNYFDINSSNEGAFVVTVDAPAPASETTVNLGTVITTTSVGSSFTFKVSGNFTKHMSPYCGMSVNSDGSSAFGFNNSDGWFYDPQTNQTTVECYAYQSNKPTTGDTVYLHPFDWESSGTEIFGDTYPLEAYNANGTVNQNQFYKIYLGYHEGGRYYKIKAREITTSENLSISLVNGTYSQIIGG